MGGGRWRDWSKKQQQRDYDSWDVVPTPAAKAAAKVASKKALELTGDREAASLAYKKEIRKHMADGSNAGGAGAGGGPGSSNGGGAGKGGGKGGKGGQPAGDPTNGQRKGHGKGHDDTKKKSGKFIFCGQCGGWEYLSSMAASHVSCGGGKRGGGCDALYDPQYLSDGSRNYWKTRAAKDKAEGKPPSYELPEEEDEDENGMEVEGPAEGAAAQQNEELQARIEEHKGRRAKYQETYDLLKHDSSDPVAATTILRKIREADEAITRMEEPAEEAPPGANDAWNKANEEHKKATLKAQKAARVAEASTKEVEAIKQALRNAECKLETDAQLSREAKAELSLAANRVSECNAPAAEKAEDAENNDEELEDDDEDALAEATAQFTQEREFYQQQNQQQFLAFQQMHLQMAQMQAALAEITVEDPVRAAQLKALSENQLAPPVQLQAPPEQQPAASKSKKTGAKTRAGPKQTIGKSGKPKGQQLPPDAVAARARVEELKNESGSTA